MAHKNPDRSLFSDFLTQLGVPHTDDYSNQRFANMPFNTLFGLSKLLEEYGIKSQGLNIEDKKEITKLCPPFLAHTKGGFTIVTNISPTRVTYMTQSEQEIMGINEFEEVWDGNVLIAFPTPAAKEPDFISHERYRLLQRMKNWALWTICGLLFAYLLVTNGLYKNLSQLLVAFFDLTGLYLTYLLVQKSLKIKNKTADKVCGILQEGGCDSILELKSSKFFGLFSWSEVGFAYFSISLLTLLIFPQWTNYLAACNVCCLPFTFWSIWYQKFRAKKWCTLCVSVQGTLWCLFFCYLGGGWLREVFPLHIEFFVLGLTYLFTLLGLNKILPNFSSSDRQSISDSSESGADPIK